MSKDHLIPAITIGENEFSRSYCMLHSIDVKKTLRLKFKKR